MVFPSPLEVDRFISNKQLITLTKDALPSPLEVSRVISHGTHYLRYCLCRVSVPSRGK